MNIGKDKLGRISVSFRYNPDLVAKVKSFPYHKWYPEEKYWSFPDTIGTLEKTLKAFEGEEFQIDPSLQTKLPHPVIAKGTVPDLRTEQCEVVESGPSPKLSLLKQSQKTHYASPITLHDFQDLRSGLLPRKYSYKTVKGYIYYNRDFLSFIKNQPSDTSDSGIKDYLLYLAEKRQSATATLNQTINALKFYYGSMLKRKFVYEVKRPRKDKKLPVVLSKEEVAKNSQFSG